MARPGITYHDVVNAAEHLKGQGLSITIEEIRRHLGTGSSSTIAPYLRQWKNQQNQMTLLAVKEKIPHELISLMKGLWERVIDQADERLIILKQNTDQEILQLKEELNQATDGYIQAQQQYHHQKQTNTDLTNEKIALKQEVANLNNENTALFLQQESLVKQLQERQDRIQELNRLHAQVQSNLEHYREAAREQRLLDLEHFKKQQKQSEHTIQQLTQKITPLEHEYIAIKKEYEEARREHEHTHQRLTILLQEVAQLRDKCVILEKEQIEDRQGKEHWQLQYVYLQQQTKEQNNAMVELQQQITVLKEQLCYIKDQNDKLTHQNKSILHEKWSLVQEKAQLEGQLIVIRENVREK